MVEASNIGIHKIYSDKEDVSKDKWLSLEAIWYSNKTCLKEWQMRHQFLSAAELSEENDFEDDDEGGVWYV